jgi:hypothetical protein
MLEGLAMIMLVASFALIVPLLLLSIVLVKLLAEML